MLFGLRRSFVTGNLNLIKRWNTGSSSNEHRDRSCYKYFLDIQTRWRDNDIYGHVNNVVYYEWIDSIVNHYLIERCALDPLTSPLIGFVVSSWCEYYSPLNYPMKINAGLLVKKIGRSSVDYQVGIFSNERENLASAVGGFRHVFVQRSNGKSHSISNEMKENLSKILFQGSN